MRSTVPLGIFAVAALVAGAAAQLELVLLHANDMHSRFDETDVYCNECNEELQRQNQCYGGMARVAKVVRDEKASAAARNIPSLFMVAGDTFQGTPYFSFFKWKPCVEFINELRPDVMTLGNHEFDDGVGSLVSYLNGLKDIPTVVANINATAEPDLKKFLLPSVVLTINNTKVGIVGYLTTDTPNISNTGAVEFFEEIETLKKETKKLRDSGVKIIIGLGHSGIEKDIEIAKEVEDIDLIVGGHSHTFLYSGTPPSIEKPYGSYPYYVTNNKNKNVPILQAFANTKYIGKVELKFNNDGDLVSISGSPTLLGNKISQDPSMLTVLNHWKPNVTEITNITVGRTAVELMNTCHREECNIGNLIADSFVHYNMILKDVYHEYWTDAPIGLVQAGGIRTSLIETNQDGYISLGQLINVMPFANNLVKVTISGASVLEAFEHSISDYQEDRGAGKMLQMSGALVEYDLTKAPGHRVSSLLLRCGNCPVPKYEPVVLTANYTIVMNDYMAGGGDSFVSFTKSLKKNEILNIEDYNATAIYMKAISPITNGLERRVSFKSNNEKSSASKIYIHKFKLLLIIFPILLFLKT